jgi:hypothetical protein
MPAENPPAPVPYRLVLEDGTERTVLVTDVSDDFVGPCFSARPEGWLDMAMATTARGVVVKIAASMRSSSKDHSIGLPVVEILAPGEPSQREVLAAPKATVPCDACGGRGMVLYGRETEDGCDACGASGQVDAVAEVARLRERVKHHEMQATHHAMLDADAREAAKREADGLRAEVARLTECLRRANASLEETERTLYLAAQAAEAERDRAVAALASVEAERKPTAATSNTATTTETPADAR